MIVFRVCLDMPELLPLLPLLLLDRVGVGVVTARDVELLTDPSVAVTMMTVVEVTGVGVAVVVALESGADVVPAEEAAVDTAVSDADVEGASSVWDVEVEVGVLTAADVEEGVVMASVVVGSVEVVGSAVVVGVVIAAVLVSLVVGAVVVVSSAVVVADANVFTLPLGPRSARRSL